MRNPVRDETAAFHLVLLAGAGAVAVGLLGLLVDRWAALGVFLALAAAVLLARPLHPRVEPRAPAAVTAHAGPRRILVLANETLAGDELRDALAERLAGRPAEVRLVAPALSSRLRYWASDTDAAVAAARARLDASLERLERAGVHATGAIGADDPVQALEDALWEFPADEVIVSTHEPGRSHWLARRVVDPARERVAVPVSHVVVRGPALPPERRERADSVRRPR
ncbi:MAG: hypothetical protein R3C15_14675 [Thermoleophilia bacterium]